MVKHSVNGRRKPPAFERSVIDFDFDFNILTAFIRLGRAGPRRGPGAIQI